MKDTPQYLFRSGELYLPSGNDLPVEIPSGLAASVLDSYSVALAGVPSDIHILADAKREPAVGAPVSPTVSGVSSGDGWIRLRAIMASPDPRLAALAAPATRALGLINWHHATRFCSRCGKPLTDHDRELARHCAACGSLYFPRISPAIIVLVEKDGKILLARHSQRNQDMYSCLAGFLEHGESLEQCVAREVFEETHLEVHNIRYAGSQSWPFPDQHMVAFHAEWKSGEIIVDPSEILEAQWFSRAELPNTPMPGTVAWNLIHDHF
jgi:NAD+ diphosphatase